MNAKSAATALARLEEGNLRYVSGESKGALRNDATQRQRLVAKQEPFAIVLACSDSRVPIETVFDQGLGNLFVVRVAGNIAGPSQIGSIEFAAEQFGTRLVVVLGHTNCGAVTATLKAMEHPAAHPSPHLNSIIDEICHSLQSLPQSPKPTEPSEQLQQAVRANIRTCVKNLHQRSDTLRNLADNEGLVIVGAEYSLDSGHVDFFEGVPAI